MVKNADTRSTTEPLVVAPKQGLKIITDGDKQCLETVTVLLLEGFGVAAFHVINAITGPLAAVQA